MTWTAVNLGLLSGGTQSQAFAVSTNGTVTVGTANDSAGNFYPVYWDASNVIHTLPNTPLSPGGLFGNVARAISSDGTKCCGQSQRPQTGAIWIGGPSSWVQTKLGVTGGVSSEAYGMSADGSVIVGTLEVTGNFNNVPCVWDATNPTAGPTLLPTLGHDNPTNASAALCCNANGTIIFGKVRSASGKLVPAKWTGGPSWALTVLNVPSGTLGNNVVNASNSSGSVAIGFVTSNVGAFDTYAATWTGLAFTELPFSEDGRAWGCDSTGLIIGGSDLDAVVWVNGDDGTDLGIFAGGTSSADVFGVSPDGATLVGDGIDGSSRTTAVKWTSAASSTVATMADLFFSPTSSFVDFTQPANRRKFIFVNGGAQNLQSDGSGPFAVAPPVFLSVQGADVPANFGNNQGRGGAFMVSGPALTDGASDPPPVTLSTETTSTTVPFSAVLGDYLTGNIYVFNPQTLTDNGQQRKWVRRWRALPGDTTSSITFSYLALNMKSGIDVPPGTNPQLVLRWSDDGGKTWSGNRIIPVGVTGETTFTVKFNRLGSTQRFSGSTRIFELSSTDQFKVNIISAEVLTK